MSHDDKSSNNSGNRPFQDVLDRHRSRRQVLAGSLGAAVSTFFVTAPAAALAGRGGRPGGRGHGRHGHHHGRRGPWRNQQPLTGFTPVPLAGGGGVMPRVSEDYQYQVLIPWGEPLQPGGPAFDWPPTADAQAQQIGIGHDGMWFFPMGYSNERGLLVINHEYGSNRHVLGKSLPDSLEEVRVSQHAHGVSVVEVAQVNGSWQQVRSGYSRRIHGNTPVTFSGPVANSPLLENPAGNAPQGTLNNCANGYTPWGTYLTCEENFNGYFGATGDWQPTTEQERYGFVPSGFGYGWHLFDERFDLSNPDYVNEDKRYGWVVEIDPMAPWSRPVKRTALGRFKHEGIAITEGRGGRVVGYMGDDQSFDYIYKFVSEQNWRAMRARGRSPLDHGTLYVARFHEDGSGEWLPLSIDNPVLAAAFADQAEVLTFARRAADLLGATPMDRPEWTTVDRDGMVYCALTNNSNRSETGPASPLAPNPDGHIIRWRDSDDHVGTTFEWELYLIAETTHGSEESFSDPDGIWADPDGRLFIQTDGGQKDGLNNQMVVADIDTGEIRRLFEGPRGCEITGLTVTPDRRTMFINVQHPGNGDPSQTSFPAPFDGVTIPRDATIVLTRKDGGIIGS